MSNIYEMTFDTEKANRNGRLFSDKLLARCCNEGPPREILYKDKVVGHIEHACRDGANYVARIILSNDMSKEIRNLAVGICGLADVSENDEYRELTIKSIDFVDRI